MFVKLFRLLLPCCVLLLSACATAPLPARLGLQLAPVELGQEIALQQHLTIDRNGKVDEMDAALEIDAGHLHVVGLALGMRVLDLNYDGKTMTTWRHFMLPQQVRAEDILEDMQLTLWPLDSIRNALPPGWRIFDQGLHRSLYLDDRLICMITYSGMPRWSGTVVLENLRYHYRITIQSLDNDEVSR